MKSTSISVNIDLEDDFEVSLLKYVQSKGNKSKYIKRLIYDAMKGFNHAPALVVQEEEKNEAMDGFF